MSVGLTWLFCVFEGLPGMTGLDELVWYGARVCLVAMFPFSAVDKIWHWKNSLAQTASDRLPGAKLMLFLAIVVEFVTPICIVAGVYDRIAAFLLAGFCVVTAFLYHPFWAYPDFWTQSDSSQAREHFWQFLKNFGLVGAYCLLSSLAISPRPRWYYARHLPLVGMQLAHRRSRPKRKHARRSVAVNGGL
jgi:putative oxidoreductase